MSNAARFFNDGQPNQYPVDLESHTCYRCGVIFGVPVEMVSSWRDGKTSLRCINPQCDWPSFVPGKSAKQKLKEVEDGYKRRLAFERNDKLAERRRREHAERSRATYKGLLTRARNRAAAGKCPVCEEHVSDSLAAHMADKHPPKETNHE